MPDQPPLLLDESRADVRVEFAMARAEVAHSVASRAHAEVMAACADAVAEVRADAGVGVADVSVRDAVELAERAIVADLAVRLAVSEPMVRSWVHQVGLLRGRLPLSWTLFREGELSPAHARIAAELVTPLPAAVTAEFDTAVRDLRTLPPARFRSRLRTLAARLDSAVLEERCARAASERRVWIEHTHDGMAWLTALLPVAAAQRAFVHVDRMAATLIDAPEESRTLAQARADVFADLLGGVLGALSSGSRGADPRVSVAVTVPVMTLLGHSDEPALLDGIHPIDAETARGLAGHAPSFTRLLTDPISGVVLGVDRGTYRVPADLKRWVRALHPTCTFPGCGRRTRDCDLDHVEAYAAGGATSAHNLAPLCRHHHRLKHETRWSVVRERAAQDDAGMISSWTSPTGHRAQSAAPSINDAMPSHPPRGPVSYSVAPPAPSASAPPGPSASAPPLHPPF